MELWFCVRNTKAKPKTAANEKSSARLSPTELVKLAKRMVDATDPAEKKRLKKEMERGFYGDPAHA